jgi:sulfate transport system substrate-binding protein
VKTLFTHVPVLDTGARGSTTTFVQRGIGDVLLAWENEAFLAVKEFGKDQVDIVVPSISILAEPPVALVDKVAEKKGNLALASAYLETLYTPEAQRLAAKHFYRPRDPAVAKEFQGVFPTLSLLTINDFGGWKAAQKRHFDDGGIFDKITQR